jgi:succinate dehydrogenase/fumarate reductase flavoprotein subunit
MSTDCGVVRDATALQLASETLADLANLAADLPPRTVETYEVCNLLRVSRSIVAGATARLESRGAHARRDYPESSDAFLGRLAFRGGLLPAFVAVTAAGVREVSQS